MRATYNQTLAPIKDCYIEIPVTKLRVGDEIQGIGENNTEGITMVMNILPDISDSKSASYADESAIGRTMPFKTYQYSENRTISWTAHFVIQSDQSNGNLDEGVVTPENMFEYLRAIESAVYPFSSEDAGYLPPVICRLKCGGLLQRGVVNEDGNNEPIHAVMKNYSVKFDTSVPWRHDSLLPYKIDIDMNFDVVYNQTNLPGSDQILGNFGPGFGEV